MPEGFATFPTAGAAETCIFGALGIGGFPPNAGLVAPTGIGGAAAFAPTGGFGLGAGAGPLCPITELGREVAGDPLVDGVFRPAKPFATGGAGAFRAAGSGGGGGGGADWMSFKLVVSVGRRGHTY